MVLPPAGFILGLVVAQDDRELGTRICVIALLALVVWLFLLLG